MKAHLLFRDRDFNLNDADCFGKEELTSDLELGRILNEMSQGDAIIRNVCAAAMFRPLTKESEIVYRQEILSDALRNPAVVRKLYNVINETFEKKRKVWSWLAPTQYLSSNFSTAVQLLRIYTNTLMELRKTANENIDSFASGGFRNLFALLQQELGDDYFAEIRAHLEELQNRDGVLISATLGNWNQGIGYVMRRKNRKGFWRRWTFAPSYTIAPRDDSGASDLENRRERAINESTNALAQAAEHLEAYFNLLRQELAFYLGCIHLKEKLETLNMPICIPDVMPGECEDREWKEFYDISLALTKNEPVTGNELSVKEKRLYLITGANQGGKSTFLRSVGQAQIMAQCGMFVGAKSMSVPIRCGIYSHFKKEEDSAMKSGKLDEELCRMDAIADHLEKGSMMLFNESFAATNEREGSEICRQITLALLNNGVEVFSVTHLYTYAMAFSEYSKNVYLRAQRLPNGKRTYHIVPGDPEETAFGEDLYRKIFVCEFCGKHLISSSCNSIS